MDSKPGTAHWRRSHGSGIELKSTESTKVWTDAESVHGERNGSIGGLGVWVTRSVEMGKEPEP
jgi:hypothetical protein